MHGEIRGQLAGASSLLPSCGFRDQSRPSGLAARVCTCWVISQSVSLLNSIFIFCGNFLVSFRCLFSLGIHSGICSFLWTYLSSFLWTFCPGFHPSHSHWVMYSGIESSSRRHIVMVFVSFMVLLWGLHIKSQIVVGFFFLNYLGHLSSFIQKHL